MIKGDDSIYPNPADAYSKGLTLRQFFAAMAMQGYITPYADTRNPDGAYFDGQDETNIAVSAVALADALIEALNK